MRGPDPRIPAIAGTAGVAYKGVDAHGSSPWAEGPRIKSGHDDYKLHRTASNFALIRAPASRLLPCPLTQQRIKTCPCPALMTPRPPCSTVRSKSLPTTGGRPAFINF
jgi:hypothetical protein